MTWAWIGLWWKKSDVRDSFGIKNTTEPDGHRYGKHLVARGLIPGGSGDRVVNEWSTDGSQIQAAIGGDHDALSAVWREHRRWVAAILIAHKPRETDLEDLLQVVAMQVCRKMSEVRDPNLFRPWLRTVAINAARGEGRKVNTRKRGMLRFVGFEHPNRRGVSDATHANGCSDDAKRVLAAALQLPESYREPVLMRCLKNMSYKQISAVLELPETTVETRIARGRRMLREIVQINDQQSEKQQQRELNKQSSMSDASASAISGGAR